MALIEIDGLPFLKMGGCSMAMLNNQMVDIPSEFWEMKGNDEFYTRKKKVSEHGGFKPQIRTLMIIHWK